MKIKNFIQYDSEKLKLMVIHNINFPKCFFTKEVISNLKLINLVDFLKWFDSDNIIYYKGNFRLKKDHSITLNYCFSHDFSNDFTCTPIDFLINYYNCNFYQSIYILYNFYAFNNYQNYIYDSFDNYQKDEILSISIDDIKRNIKNNKYTSINGIKNIYAYLNQSRGLSIDTINYLAENKLIFAEVLSSGYNIIFPFYDYYDCYSDLDDMIGMEINGTLSSKEYRYKKSLTSIKYSFYKITPDFLESDKPIKYFIFESAIDLISLLDLYFNHKIDIDLKNSIFISLRGLNLKILDNLDIKDNDIIYSCVDSDSSAEKFNNKLSENYKNEIYYLSLFLKQNNFKDCNDFLKNSRKFTNRLDESVIFSDSLLPF